MGSGASSGISTAIISATDEELKELIGSLDEEARAKVMAGMSLARGSSALTLALIRQQNSATTAAIIKKYEADETFKRYAAAQTEMIMKRDAEDGDKLAKGVQLAIDKGVLSKDVKVEPTVKVSVTGKSADSIADEIIKALGDAPSKGCIMALQGLSGTGKGTTVAKLQERLPKSQTWSNGNLFRSLTLLAVTKSEQDKTELKDQLTPDALKSFQDMLSFDKFGDRFDVKIEGLGLKYFVSEVEKTVLKEPRVGKNIPTVAEVTQGEVVNFVQGALGKMVQDGMNVLVEGREQTLNHIRTPHRFELVLEDTSIIGMRQAALVMGGKANDALKDASDDSAVKGALDAALADLSK